MLLSGELAESLPKTLSKVTKAVTKSTSTKWNLRFLGCVDTFRNTKHNKVVHLKTKHISFNIFNGVGTGEIQIKRVFKHPVVRRISFCIFLESLSQFSIRPTGKNRQAQLNLLIVFNFQVNFPAEPNFNIFVFLILK